MPSRPLSLHLPTADATADLGRRLAPHLRAGDTILLSGGIGAGKTHFARAAITERLARAGRREDVPSPTYTLVQVYDDGAAEIWHADLYRLEAGSGAGVELGLDEAFETAICLVEWPERLDDPAPAGALRIAFRPDGTGRVAILDAPAPRWSDVLAALAGDAADVV